MSMMSKNEVDDYFTDQWTFLEQKAKEIHANMRGNGDADDLLQEAYMYLLDNNHKMTSKSIESFFVRFVSSQIRWRESKHNISVLHPVAHTRYSNHERATPPNDNDLESKILQEEWYMSCKGAMELYKMESQRNRILLDLYIELEGNTKAIAKRLDISPHSAWRLTSDMKKCIKQIRDEQ